MDQSLGPGGPGQRGRSGIGGAAIVEPTVVFDECEQLRREIAALGQEVPGALAPHERLVGQGGVEQDQGLGAHPAVLDKAKRQRLDPGAPSQVGRALSGRGDGVGETCPVHVEAQAPAPRHLTQRGDFGGTIDEAILTGVGDRQCAGLDLMNVGPDPVACGFDGGGLELCPLPFEQHQLGAVGEEARGASLVDFDVRVAVAQDRTLGRTHRRQREAVGRRPGRHPQRAHRGSKQVGEGAVEPLAPSVAVIGGIEPVGRRQRREHGGVASSGVVGEEAHRRRMAGCASPVNRTSELRARWSFPAAPCDNFRLLFECADVVGTTDRPGSSGIVGLDRQVRATAIDPGGARRQLIIGRDEA